MADERVVGMERVVGIERVVAIERIVGIDLGTTNSLVAFMEGAAPQVIPGEDGDRLVPSVVAFPSGGGVLVGNAARGALLREPGRAVYSAKRLMGRGVADVAEELGLFPFRLAGGGEGLGEKQVPFGDDNKKGKDRQKGEGLGEKQVPFGDDNKRGEDRQKGEGQGEKQVPFGDDNERGGDREAQGTGPSGGGADVVRLRVGDRVVTPPEVSAYVLQQLKRNAERFFGGPVSKAVITVPAYFNDAQRQATKDAGRIAGLEVLRLVNEPTAAALAYGLDKSKDGLIAVYDFGGGTFDVSILKLHEGIFEVVATGGDTHLGGDDIDNLLISVAVEDIRGDLGVDVRADAGVMQALRKAVIEAKIGLSTEGVTRLVVEVPVKQVPFGDDNKKSNDNSGDDNKRGNGGGGKRVYAREITREQFEGLIAGVVERTAGPVRQALKDAGVGAEAIDEVVMVGGSTRIPAVRRMVDGLFGMSERGKALHTELNPDEVVALGAAVQAQILSGQANGATEDLLLLDVTPLSLGIEALGGVVAKIIQRNSTIPASATEHFTTGVDGQTNVAIHVLQGERELAKDCRSLARFDLKGIPPMMAGMARIEVKLLIDANGILTVSAREQRSGTEAEIDVKPTYGLTDEQVEEMILASFDNAEADIKERQVIEATNEAETILEAVKKAKSQPTWQLLTAVEIAAIERCEMEVKASIKGGDYAVIRQSIERLDASTRRLAELMMDGAVTGALGGKSMATADQEMGSGPTAPHPFAKAEIEDAVAKVEGEGEAKAGHSHSKNEMAGSTEG